MISKLRRRHRRWTPVLLGVVPAVVLVGAIGGRNAVPVVGELPTVVAASIAAPSPRTSLGQIWDGFDLEALLARAGQEATLVIQITDAPLKPDLLLFWSPADAEIGTTPESIDHRAGEADGGQLPAGSVLLGVFRETNSAVFALPEVTRRGEGRLVLYSLPYRQVVSVSRPVNLN